MCVCVHFLTHAKYSATIWPAPLTGTFRWHTTRRQQQQQEEEERQQQMAEKTPYYWFFLALLMHGTVQMYKNALTLMHACEFVQVSLTTTTTTTRATLLLLPFCSPSPIRFVSFCFFFFLFCLCFLSHCQGNGPFSVCVFACECACDHMVVYSVDCIPVRVTASSRWDLSLTFDTLQCEICKWKLNNLYLKHDYFFCFVYMKDNKVIGYYINMHISINIKILA